MASASDKIGPTAWIGPRFGVIVLGISLACLYLLGLGNHPLTERSESRYVGVAWEMQQSGDYLTPRYNGIKHFHKPPLFYWLTALSMEAFGDSEGAARLPCALAALATLGLTGWLAGQPGMRCRRPWLAVAFLGTAPFFWEMGRIAVTDMVVSLLVLISLCAAWSLLSKPPSWRSQTIFWASMGLNFLNKGPVGGLIVGMVLLPYLWRTHTPWRVFVPLRGLLLAAAIGLPWYLGVTMQNPGLLGYFLKFQTADRVFTTVHHRGGPIWFYLPVLLGGFLPWTGLLLGAFQKGFGALRVDADTDAAPAASPNPDLLLLLWIVLPAIFFSLIGSKLPPYVLPLFPAMAILVARHFDALASWLKVSPLAVLASAALGLAMHQHFPMATRLSPFAEEIRWGAWWLSASSVVIAVLLVRKRPTWSLLGMLVAMTGLLGIAITATPKLEYRSARPLVQAITRVAHPPFEVAMVDSYLFGLPYYLRQNIVHVAHQRETQFETEPAFQARVFDSLPSYLTQFRQGDKDRFLILPNPMNAALTPPLTENVVFQDGRYTVLYHPADPMGTRP